MAVGEGDYGIVSGLGHAGPGQIRACLGGAQVVQRHRREELAPTGVGKPGETGTGPCSQNDQRCRWELR